MSNNVISNKDIFVLNERGNHLKKWTIELTPEREAVFRRNQAPESPFNPFTIDYIINKGDSLESILLKQKKLSSKQKIQLENIQNKQQKLIKNDYESLEKYGTTSILVTKEGKDLQLLMILQNAIEKEDNNLITNLYLKLLNWEFESEHKTKYIKYITRMNKLINKIDIIEYQFLKAYNSMPPLDRNQFILDEWQLSTINHIKNKESIIVMCPTSSGKTICSSYVITKSNHVLFIVPTDALAYQVGAYFTKILNSCIPILTKCTDVWNSTQTLENLDEAKIIVGTPYSVESVMPYLKKSFGYIVFDEIHCLNDEYGDVLERLIKWNKDCPFLALSASIGNLDELHNWWQSFTKKKIQIIKSVDRVFNLQKGVYNNKTESVEYINPMSLITIDDFIDKSILTKNLEPTPVDVWNLYIQINNRFDLKDLVHTTFFTTTKRISLSEVNSFFKQLILFLVNKLETDTVKITEIITHFQKNNFNSENINLTKLCLNLKNTNKIPSIIFQLDTKLCEKYAINLTTDLEKMEADKFPNYKKDLMKKYKQYKKWQDKNEHKLNNLTEKQMTKILQENTNKELPSVHSVYEPHSDFVLTNGVLFTEDKMEEWSKFLRKYFHKDGDEYHPIIRALWRGIGVYAKGLPSNYLRLVQQLACQKQLAIVFSDKELVYGVSMPFKSVVIYNDQSTVDKVDSLINLQMSGRAGRRGLDKEGYTIYAGYSHKRISELCSPVLPIIKGRNINLYSLDILKHISTKTYLDLLKYPLNKELNNDAIISLDDKLSEFKDEFAYNAIWKLRKNNKDSLLIFSILKYIVKEYNRCDVTVEKNQIDLTYMMLHFICPYKNNSISFDTKYDNIYEELHHTFEINKNSIDGDLYKCISMNTVDSVIVNNPDIYNRLKRFGEIVRILQNYCYLSNKPIVKLLGKLFTRIWWIYFQ
jgi:ERCC4-related helicase